MNNLPLEPKTKNRTKNIRVFIYEFLIFQILTNTILESKILTKHYFRK